MLKAFDTIQQKSRLFLSGIMLCFLFACNRHGADSHTPSVKAAIPEQVQPVSTSLLLHDGAKWKSDSITRKNVNLMAEIIDQFNKGSDKSKSAHRKAGEKLKKAVNTLISECRMSGPEHEILHKWLEPMIEQLSGVPEISDKEDIDRFWLALLEQVNLFSEYFE